MSSFNTDTAHPEVLLKTGYRFESFNIKGIIDIAILDCQETLKRLKKNDVIKIFSDIPDDCGYINGDQSALSKVIRTLLRSAIQDASKEKISVSVNVVDKKMVSKKNKKNTIIDGKQYILVSIANKGKKISDIKKNKTLENLETEISVCRNIIRDHSGYIWEENKNGNEHYSLWSFAIPCYHAERRSGADRRKSSNRKKNTIHHNSKIVELMMSNINGYEFCKQIRNKKKFHDIPIIVITTSHEDRYETYSFQIGANDYLKKPINKEKLLARINTLLQIQKYKKKINDLTTPAEFVSWISHELNNSNQAGMSITEKMQKYDPEGLSHETYHFMLTKIMRSFEKMRDVVDSISQYGKFGTTVTNVPYHEVVDSVVSYVYDTFLNRHDKNITLIVRKEKEKNIVLAIDKGMIEIALFNMIKNAYQSIQERMTEELGFQEKGVIRLFSTHTKRSLRITIEDNGKGISHRNINSICNKNFTTKLKGKGIGLFLAQRVAMDHGGKLTIESLPGTRTRLTITLPIKIPVLLLNVVNK